MMQRLDAIEKQHAQYLNLSESSVLTNSSSNVQPQTGNYRWTEEEHSAYLTALETIPKQNAQQIADIV